MLAEKSEDASEAESGQCPLQLRAVQVRNCSGDAAKRTKSQDSTHQHNGNDMHTKLGQICIRRAMLPVDGSVELLEFHLGKLLLPSPPVSATKFATLRLHPSLALYQWKVTPPKAKALLMSTWGAGFVP